LLVILCRRTFAPTRARDWREAVAGDLGNDGIQMREALVGLEQFRQRNAECDGEVFKIPQ